MQDWDGVRARSPWWGQCQSYFIGALSTSSPLGNFLVCLCVWVLHGRRLVALDTTDTWSY